MSLNNYTVSSDQLKNEAHVWFCHPDEITDDKLLSQYHSLLGEEEKQRLERFHFKKDQHNYLISHALVRLVLSEYADLKPEAWQFQKNSHGRPDIKQAANDTSLKFNLTHTKGLCACVVTCGAECGIDAEIVNRKNNLKKIAQRMFADSELDTMKSLHGWEFREAFFRFWTLRESYVKALGTGLAGSSKAFHFCIDDKAEIEFKNSEADLDKEQWQFALLEPTENHIAAVALRHTTQDKLNIVSRKAVPKIRC